MEQFMSLIAVLLTKDLVLKVIPTAVYSFHGKNFEDECQLHDDVASGIDHVVGIRDFFDEQISFGDISLSCHVAVLDYVDGTELDEFLKSPGKTSARTLAQLATDVFRLLQALDGKGVYHNDLHHKNLLVQLLPPSQHRPEAIDETIRLVAVDLGSLADRSRSGPPRQALGDLTSAALLSRRIRQSTFDESRRDSRQRLSARKRSCGTRLASCRQSGKYTYTQLL